MYWVVKLSRQGGQYRITLPRGLLTEAGLKEAELLRLEWFVPSTIIIEEYHGKAKEKGSVQEDKTRAD